MPEGDPLFDYASAQFNLAGQTPQITCPACGQVVGAVSGSEDVPARHTPGSSPVAFNLSFPLTTHRCSPCQCPVDGAWAVEFGKEMQSRRFGYWYRPVTGLDAVSRKRRLAELEGVLSRLYTVQLEARHSGQKEAADTWITRVVQEMYKLFPLQRPKAPTPDKPVAMEPSWFKEVMQVPVKLPENFWAKHRDQGWYSQHLNSWYPPEEYDIYDKKPKVAPSPPEPPPAPPPPEPEPPPPDPTARRKRKVRKTDLD